MKHSTLIRFGIAGLLLAVVGLRSASVQSDPVYFAGSPPSIAQVPLYLKDAVPPLNMLVMGKDQKTYFEAYNDASDLNGDGALDVGYKPDTIEYYGYFNSYACYDWQTDKFVPVSKTTNKKCSGRWSGDFLNYVTTSRMDALRRVLYGGWRQVDTDTQTVLQGAYFPQDGHSWGKEYQSIGRDGYDIRQYTPLSLPADGRYHLFAITTLTGNNATFPNYQAPVFRILKDSPYRIWNWLSIEGPVAGNKCFTSGNSRVDCASGGATAAFPGDPASRNEYNTLEANFAISNYRFGSGSIDQINCTNSACNPFGVDDNYLTIIDGTIHIGNGSGNDGYYQFSVDGDDAVDLQIKDGATVIGQAGFYAGHDVCNCNSYTTNPINMGRGDDYSFHFRHEDGGGGDQYIVRYRKVTLLFGNIISATAWQVLPGGNGDGQTGIRDATITTYNLTPSTGAATRDMDRFVRVLSCPDNPDLQETTCHAYPNGHFKPTGILHDYGETKRMYFGLITGSQANNIEGGVLRRNISSFADEINAASGTFKSGVGIADTISRFRMIGGGYANGVTDNTGGDTNWNWANGTGNCTSQGGSPLSNGQCRMWGNPIAEMMYESMRYFAGAAAPTARFASGGASQGNTEDATMGLGTETWKDPYAGSPAGGGYPTCAKPYETVISDINPSFDGDLPGSAFAGAATSTSATPASISGFSAAAEGQTVWNAEYGGTRRVFIGEANGVTDGAPTAKSVSSFGNIRGLSPEEPSKNGTYYAASVARFARNTDLNAIGGQQNLSTYSIALASPLPRIEVPLDNGTVTLNPFAKTVSGTFGDQARKPTNTIVDFYVQEINNFPGQPRNMTINGGYPKAIFRINYEDVEQGNDFDMDAIARYEITAKANSVDVQVISEYAAGSANQYMGYTLSGTNGKDGVYLEICDLKDGTGNPGNSSDRTLCSSTTSYALNTPPGRNPNYCSGSSPPADCAGLPPTSGVRTFSPGSGSDAIQLQNPLWYAAKYGAPNPAQVDTDGDGTPDNYFLVTNPLNLRKQLSKAFDDIVDRDLAVGTATISGARVGNSSFTLQPTFKRGRNNKDWTGNLSAVAVNPDGTLGTSLWNAQANLPAPAVRTIRTIATMGDGTSATGTGIKPVDFTAVNLGTNDAARYAALGIAPGNVTTLYGAAYSPADFVAYLRGDQSREASTGTAGNTLRTRSAVLGDIVNSEPIIVSPRNNYGYLYYSDGMFDGYDTYLADKTSRKTVAFAGANDGMLHAFDASTQPCSPNNTLTCAAGGAGKELYAFIPNGALKQLGNLPLPDDYFNHRYTVDGGITAGDARTGTTWKTLVVGTMGGGGRSVFALDVTTPDILPTDKVLWERNSSVDLDIGNVYGKPLLVPLENGSWGVLFGNGYGGNLSDPSLYILDAFTGKVIKKITANDGNPAATPVVLPILGELINGLICSVTQLVGGQCATANAPFNGLGQITAIDKDGDGKVDTVYGGDLQGNLWKFDLSASAASGWKVANGGLALLNASTGTEKQPITGGIRVAAGPGTGVMLYFGTGRYFLEKDNDVVATPQVQSLYAFFDNFIDTSPTVKTRADLVEQKIDFQGPEGDYTTRTINASQVFYYGTGAKRGWFIDLKISTDAKGVGERFIATPLVQSGRIFFTTYTPSANSCDPGGTNFQYALDLLSGAGALSNVQVLPTGTVACKGANCGAVAIGGADAGAQPPVVGTGVAAINPVKPANPTCDKTKESCPTFEECQVVIYPGSFVLPRPCGRQSWRQLK